MRKRVENPLDWQLYIAISSQMFVEAKEREFC